MADVIDRIGIQSEGIFFLFKIAYSPNGDLVEIRDGFTNGLIYDPKEPQVCKETKRHKRKRSLQ